MKPDGIARRFCGLPTSTDAVGLLESAGDTDGATASANSAATMPMGTTRWRTRGILS